MRAEARFQAKKHRAEATTPRYTVLPSITGWANRVRSKVMPVPRQKRSVKRTPQKKTFRVTSRSLRPCCWAASRHRP